MSGSLVTDVEREVRDMQFDPWRFARTEKAQLLIDDAVASVEGFETKHQLRTRARKKADHATFEASVSAILCDLIHHRLYQRPLAVYVTRSNQKLGTKSRYRPAVYGKQFPRLLDLLIALRWIVQDLGDGDGKKGKATTILAGERLLTAMDDRGISFGDIGYLNQADPLVLKEKRTNYFERAEIVEYNDTEATLRFRREMQEVNRWLRYADIDIARARSEIGPIPDVEERSLTRRFTQHAFHSGGRLFGGFWQPMGKDDRLDRIVIDGEPIAELDYGQMAGRQLYGLVGIVPSANDLYAIPGYEKHRDGIKRLFACMVFSEQRLTKWPKGVGAGFAKGTKVTDVTNAIERCHPDISDQFYQGVGHRIQFQESQIMVDILLRLKRLGIVALPIHDAILVPLSRVEQGRRVMLEVFTDHVGIDGQVDVRHGPWCNPTSDLPVGPHGWGPSTPATYDTIPTQ